MLDVIIPSSLYLIIIWIIKR